MLGALTFSGAGFIGNTASGCGLMLTAGGACRMQVVCSLTIRGCAAGAMRLGGVGIPIDGRFVGGTEVYVRGGGPLPSSRRIVSDVIPLVRRLRRAMIGALAGAAPIDLRGPLPGLV